MSPLYEYDCPQCGKFETMKAMGQRHRARCPHCNGESKLKMSMFGFKLYNPFTKDGPGFETVYMSKEEERERIRSNALKDD